MNHLVQAIHVILEEVRGERRRGDLSNVTEISGHSNDQVNVSLQNSNQLPLRSTEVAVIH